MSRSPDPPSPPPDDMVQRGTASIGGSPIGESIPAFLTSMIGRDRELARISAVLRERSGRLVVLTGPGGVGKTRLAVAVAEHLRGDFADGVLMASLAGVSSEMQVLPAIATALGVRPTGQDNLRAAVREALAGRDLLLVLDNFEHVVGAAPLLTDLLSSSYTLSMLVTSRSVLGVYGEFVFPVPTLPTPESANAAPEAIAASDAVRLFVTRIQAFRPEFELRPDNAASIAAICQRLDGLPLAIELAAARTRLFSVTSLAQGLTHRLPMLDGGPRDVPDRLRTMRNAVSWSYELLSPLEQSVFRRLSVFSGSWSIDAAREVVITSARREGDMIDAIGSLVDKSLVMIVETIRHERYFRMLQTLREFGLEALTASGEREATEQRHTDYVLDVARRAAPHLSAGEQVYWLNMLEGMNTDLQAVFERLMAQGKADTALELTTMLWRYGYTRGYIYETRTMLERALDQATARTALRARALNGAGVLANVAGVFDRTRAHHQEALEIAREVDDQGIMAVALFGLGDVAAINDDTAEAERCYLEAERLYTVIDDSRGIATAQTNLGNLYWSLGRIDEAISLNEAARRLYETVDDQRGVAWSFTNVGRLATLRHEYPRAVQNLADAMHLYRQLGDRAGIAETLEAFALIAADTHDNARAASLLGAARHLRDELGYPTRAPDTELLANLEQRVATGLGATFATHRDAGTTMPLDAAIDLAVATEPAASRAATVTIDRAGRAAAIAARGLTDRELEVLPLVAAGLTDAEVAERLSISPRTVGQHLRSIYGKLDVRSRTEATRFAIEHQLV